MNAGVPGGDGQHHNAGAAAVMQVTRRPVFDSPTRRLKRPWSLPWQALINPPPPKGMMERALPLAKKYKTPVIGVITDDGILQRLRPPKAAIDDRAALRHPARTIIDRLALTVADHTAAR
jgi:hypothetical protein